MRVGESGVNLLKHSEGLRRALYKCPAGHATIGYGHLVHHGPPDGTEPPEFRTGISEDLAEYLLCQDLREAEQAVARAVEVPLEQHQFDALVSFVFNVGAGAFRRSTLLRKLNEGDYEAVPGQLARWVWAGPKGRKQKLTGLVRRREAEAALWRGEGLDAAA